MFRIRSNRQGKRPTYSFARGGGEKLINRLSPDGPQGILQQPRFGTRARLGAQAL